MVFPALLISAGAFGGAFGGAIGLEAAMDNVYGLPRQSLDVYARLQSLLSEPNDEQTPCLGFGAADRAHKCVPSDPSAHDIPTVAGWLSTVRPMLGVTVRLYIGAGTDAFCDAGATVCGLDPRGAPGLVDELERFCRAVAAAPKGRGASLMFTVASVDRDARVEARGAAFVSNAVLDRLRSLDAPIRPGDRVAVPRDREDPEAIRPGVVLYKTLQPRAENAMCIALDDVLPTGKLCNVIVTGATGAGKSTVANLLAQCSPAEPLFPVKRNATGSTVVRCVRMLHGGVSYALYDTPGLGDVSGADPATACELWNLTREISSVSCIAHVVAHSEQRPGALNMNDLDKYLRIIGETAREKLCVVVTHNHGDTTRRTVQNAVSELVRRTGVSREAAQSRVVTVDLEAARETGTQRGSAGPGEENTESAMRVLHFTRDGEVEMEHAINARVASETLAADLVGPVVELMQTQIMSECLDGWMARTLRLGNVHEVEVESLEDARQVTVLRMGGGTRLKADKKVFTFVFHFPREDTSENFQSFESHTPEEVCDWLRREDLVPLPIGSTEGEAGVLIEYETFFYRIVDRTQLQDLRWVQNEIRKRTEMGATKAMWDRFEKLVKDHVLVPPLKENE